MQDTNTSRVLTLRDIAGLIGRDHSVVSRYRRAPSLGFPAPDFETLSGSPLWRPDTVHEWVRSRKPELEKVFIEGLTR